ncbi:hypothetical protein [Actinomadura rupiterrae]|uniref:hypothetical protein n=1 Tax=Actinomadura rupiterrae TaxID=559627 RepID=UPI0020A3C80B|nr:hypothetical protein [Actinomadura rupiterrae]MCP2342842.1 hypothetical protein [Actinomadura rupiterrae]
MLKRLAAGGLLSCTAAGVVLSAAPAMADDGPQNIQIIGIQTCRSLDIAGIGAAIHNILGVEDEHGDCVNGSTEGHVKHHRHLPPTR